MSQNIFSAHFNLLFTVAVKQSHTRFQPALIHQLKVPILMMRYSVLLLLFSLLLDRASASPPVGHLDDINAYVAEKLLQYIDEVNIGIFENLFQVRKWTLFCHFFE